MTLLLFLGVLILCVESISSSFVVTSIGKEVFNSLGVFGLWYVAKGSLSADISKDCLFWKLSDKKAFNANFTPIQKPTKGWIEVVADVSALGGLGRDGNDDGIMFLSVRNKNWGNIAALDIIKSSSGSGVSGIIMTKKEFCEIERVLDTLWFSQVYSGI